MGDLMATSPAAAATAPLSTPSLARHRWWLPGRLPRRRPRRRPAGAVRSLRRSHACHVAAEAMAPCSTVSISTQAPAGVGRQKHACKTR
jgi:hypothetical protein